MLSIFNIDLVDKVDMMSRDDIIPQIDQMLPRFTEFSSDFWLWLDDKINQDSIAVKFDGTRVHEITIRFDTEKPNNDFRFKVIEFINRNHFLLTINQKITFDSEKLTEDLIKLNRQRNYQTDRPVDFILKQRRLE